MIYESRPAIPEEGFGVETRLTVADGRSIDMAGSRLVPRNP